MSYATLPPVLSRIWLLLLAIALVSATAHAATGEIGRAEIVELETALDDLVIETAAPVLPAIVGWTEGRTAHDALPSSPPLVQVFRPPRF